MVLRRAECEDGTVQLVVLCVGCYRELTSRIPGRKQWCNDLNTGSCEFCEAEIHSTAMGLR